MTIQYQNLVISQIQKTKVNKTPFLVIYNKKHKNQITNKIS